VFYLSYMLSELRRRRGRTVLTAVGLAVGVGLVVAVSALSTGLDRAQKEVLEPLTGVGTDLSVTRPITVSDNGNGAFGGLSAKERRQLEEENGDARVGFQNLKPGQKFSRDTFVATSQLSFPATEVDEVAAIDGVSGAAGGLTLSAVHLEGTVPKDTGQAQGGFRQAPEPSQGPRSIDLRPLTVTGVDQTHPELGALTSGQVTTGRYFSGSATSREAILNVSYAKRKKLGLGDTVTVGGKKFEVVGLAETPLGGSSSDVYIKLGQLQKMSDREGRVNTIYVRATSSDQVAAVAAAVEKSFDGASATTAEDLADRVSGSLVDAKNLTSKIGTVLAIVGLLAAFLIAGLLTLSSVTKRVRELGTLKALGWRQRQVVRQVAGESVLQGVLGGLLGVGAGIGAAALIELFAPSLKATVAQAAAQTIGPFGQGAVTPGSTTVELDAPVSVGLLLAAIGLAVAGGLLAGVVGGLRAARLRPADALRHID
jgi:ABC-type antimicrobial peptide transport system permease subunit